MTHTKACGRPAPSRISVAKTRAGNVVPSARRQVHSPPSWSPVSIARPSAAVAPSRSHSTTIASMNVRPSHWVGSERPNCSTARGERYRKRPCKSVMVIASGDDSTSARCRASLCCSVAWACLHAVISQKVNTTPPTRFPPVTSGWSRRTYHEPLAGDTSFSATASCWRACSASRSKSASRNRGASSLRGHPMSDSRTSNRVAAGVNRRRRSWRSRKIVGLCVLFRRHSSSSLSARAWARRCADRRVNAASASRAACKSRFEASRLSHAACNSLLIAEVASLTASSSPIALGNFSDSWPRPRGKSSTHLRLRMTPPRDKQKAPPSGVRPQDFPGEYDTAPECGQEVACLGVVPRGGPDLAP